MQNAFKTPVETTTFCNPNRKTPETATVRSNTIVFWGLKSVGASIIISDALVKLKMSTKR